MSEKIKIERLGHQGDGVGQIMGKPVFVPFSLQEEVLEINRSGSKGDIVSIQSASKNRVDPFCKFFGSCGGCQLQHMEHTAYLEWKVALLVEAFSREKIDTNIDPIRHYPTASRRRAVLNAKKTESGYHLGFLGRASHQLIDIDYCPVLTPNLNAVLNDVRSLLEVFEAGYKETRINLLEADNGIDLGISFSGKVAEKRLLDLISHPSMQSFIRLSINSEIILEREKPEMHIGSTIISPPPDAFVQAVSEAQNDMTGLVSGHLSKCKKVVDLFSGFGTFALKLAENSQVFAVEANDNALSALDRAWRETGGKLKGLTHQKRDLFRSPVTFMELKPYDGAVFDPPRAGAEAQARELAKSKLKKIAAVSCNPQTLARDIRILLNGGFRLSKVTPIDQFAFTPHLETVVLLER